MTAWQAWYRQVGRWTSRSSVSSRRASSLREMRRGRCLLGLGGWEGHRRGLLMVMPVCSRLGAMLRRTRVPFDFHARATSRTTSSGGEERRTIQYGQRSQANLRLFGHHQHLISRSVLGTTQKSINFDKHYLKQKLSIKSTDYPKVST